MINRTSLALLSLLLLAASAFAADVSGTWDFAVETSQGSGAPTVVLKQEGDKLSGTFRSQIFGEVPLTGTVKNNNISFTFKGKYEGQEFTVEYTGTVESDTAMKGKASYGGIDNSATWTAKKK